MKRLLVLTLLFVPSLMQAAEKPNILFIFADDQCFETIRSLGHTDVETPNLDRLVKSGTTFTHTYNQGSWSGAVCVASRTMLNTGRFVWKAHQVYRTTDRERREGRFWSVMMKKAGYDTYFTGKWHVRTNPRKAFDVVAHPRGGMPNQTPQGYNRPIEGKEDGWKPWYKKFGGFWKGGKHWSEVVGDDATMFLQRAKRRSQEKKKPFFMYIAFNAPHDPRQSPKRYVDRYPLSRIKVPVNFLAEYPDKDAIGCSKRLRDEKLAPFPRSRYSVKVNRQEYYAIITHMDEQIGRILAALKKTGLEKNTYIFFTADHGLAVGHHGLMGKQNMYDHSVRVPFMAVGPGIKAGHKITAPIYLQDVMPTTLKLAGAKIPKHVQFHSLLPLLRGKTTKSAYSAVYGGYLKVQRMVTEDGYKLILYPKIGKAKLFNLREDPLEQKDLAGKTSSKSRMKKLFQTFLRLQKETGDKLQLKETFKRLL